MLLGQVDPGPAQSSGPGLAQKSIIVFFWAENGPIHFWADLGPSLFWAESGLVVWAGPARFNIIFYIYIIFCIIYIYIYIHEKIIKIMQKL